MLHWTKTLAALAFLCLAAPLASAGGKAPDTPIISFHVETESTDNPKMTFSIITPDGKQRWFRRLPEVSARDVAAFGPFPDDLGGETYGVALQLKSNAAQRLSAVTAENQGKWLIAQVNGRVVDGVLIDKQINDGFLIIWKGIELKEINAYDKFAPRIGAKDTKAVKEAKAAKEAKKKKD